MNLNEFWKLCDAHDYSYSYSDDHRYWKAGSTEEDVIKNVIGKYGAEYKKMYDAFLDFWWKSGVKPNEPAN